MSLFFKNETVLQDFLNWIVFLTPIHKPLFFQKLLCFNIHKILTPIHQPEQSVKIES